ncbi:hypothetical protein EV589_1984 [Mycobacterium sp. BK558]|nr:hypothetical protein EV589_1984 [Mycobacterium sp. BK558]
MMTTAEDGAAARKADLQQAHSLRRELAVERGFLVDRIGERRKMIRNGYSTSRAIAEMHRAEDDLTQLDDMIARLDRRFTLESGAEA